MIREWANEESLEQIEEALTPKGQALAAMWDDEDAWAEFEGAMRAERSSSAR